MRAASRIETLLHSEDPDEVLGVCTRLAGEELRSLDAVAGAAVAGNPSAIDAYVAAARRFIQSLLAAVNERQPDPAIAPGGEGAIAAPYARAAFLASYLEIGVLDAPFSPWVNRFGPGRGSALFLVSRLRTALPGASPLPISRDDAVLPHGLEMSPEGFGRFVRRAADRLPLWSDSIPQLERVKRLFHLNNSELGRLFGASRQAVTAWLEKGVPPARLPKLNAVVKIAELMQRKLKPGRLPAVVRTDAAAYGGRSMLTMIAADDHDRLLADLHETFDWAASA
jgi:DNA-binding XRE family transcriptional regulator